MSPAGRHSSADPTRSAKKQPSVAFAASTSAAHAALAKLPHGAPMEVPSLPLAPRRPSTDQTLMMALGLNTLFLQEQDFELDQRLRQLPSGPMLFLHQESMIQHVLNSKSKYNTTSLIAGCPILSEMESGRGTAAQDGEHGQLTALLLKSIPMALPLIEAEAGAFALRLANPHLGQKTDLIPAMDELACRVLTRLVLPATPPEAIDALVKATAPVQEVGILGSLARLPWQSAVGDTLKNASLVLNRRFLLHRLTDIMNTMRKPAIAESITGLNAQDVLLRLLNNRSAKKMDDAQIVRMLHSLFGGLRDQLRTMLIWTFGLLAHQEQFRHICEREADLLAQSQTPIASVLEQAVFIKAAIEESWRLYPPVPAMVWKLKQEDKIGRISVKAGSHVCIAPYVLHRHKDFWKQGNLYDPSRFLGAHRKTINPLGYMPFGASGSHCPNGAIFLPMMTVILLSILHRTRLAPPPNSTLPIPMLQNRIEPSRPLFVSISARIQTQE